MPKTRRPYAPEFRRQMIDLVCAGRDPEDLAREFEPTAQSIRNWMVQADRSEGRREEKGDGTSSAEREELIKLRREVRQLRLERDILSKAAAWFPSSGIPPADAGGTLTSLARETATIPSGSSGS
jgi:transposase